MADALRTITVDTASTPYIKSDGVATTINSTAETFTLQMTDLGSTTGYLTGGGTAVNNLALADGTRIQISLDPRFIQTAVLTDATAKLNAGSLWISEDGGPEVEWHIRTITVTDVDGTGANNLATLAMERVDNPMISVTWSNLNMA